MGLTFGLAIGLALVLFSIVSTRHACGRGRPEAVAAGLELMWWAVYLGVAAVIYVGFALRRGGEDWLPLELAGLGLYTAIAWAGHRFERGWAIALGWALHALWDVGIHHGAPEQLVPSWYRWACLVYDLVAAAYLITRARATCSGPATGAADGRE